MKPQEILNHYGTMYRFHKETGIAASSLGNWIKWGYVPEMAQYKLEHITNGLFKAEVRQKSE